MAENMYSKDQKVLSKKGKDNWDKIFKKKGCTSVSCPNNKTGIGTDNLCNCKKE